MNLKNIKSLFHKELEKLYPSTEIDSFFLLLIEQYLNFNRIDLVLKSDYLIPENKINDFNKAIAKLKKEEPIQYIIGNTEFYGLHFTVSENTLIPRPETEELVTWVLSEVEKKTNITILDIGTGSGCIPIAIAKNTVNLNISAIDISKEALKIAKQNAEYNKVDINFHEKNILTIDVLPNNYDVIISNPPYVRELEKKEIKNNVLNNEPHLALFVDDNNPLIFYNKIADLAIKHLNKDGLLFFEINQYLGKETVELLVNKGFKNIELKKDIFNNDRMIKASIN